MMWFLLTWACVGLMVCLAFGVVAGTMGGDE